MRQRRHRLQVSTFPFLAVLLCAMGSLILLLLVIDRRAKAVARAKAMRAMEQATASEAKEDEARRAEWERRRRLLHQQLAEQDQEVLTRSKDLQHQTKEVAERIQGEQVRGQELREHSQAEQSRLAQWEKELTSRRAEISKEVEKTAASEAEMARLTAALERLERTLSDLKAIRQRQQQLYSLVPYRGKRGDNRKPIYIECAADALIFHPDRRTLLGGPLLSASAVRSEIEQRLNGPLLKTANKPEENAYLLMLVRPDGITTYYRALAALQGLQVDFGYEFIDQDWILDFPQEDDTSGKQPWMAAQAAGNTSPNTTPPKRVQGLSPTVDSRRQGRLPGVAFGQAGPSGLVNGSGANQSGQGMGSGAIPDPGQSTSGSVGEQYRGAGPVDDSLIGVPDQRVGAARSPENWPSGLDSRFGNSAGLNRAVPLGNSAPSSGGKVSLAPPIPVLEGESTSTSGQVGPPGTDRVANSRGGTGGSSNDVNGSLSGLNIPHNSVSPPVAGQERVSANPGRTVENLTDAGGGAAESPTGAAKGAGQAGGNISPNPLPSPVPGPERTAVSSSVGGTPRVAAESAQGDGSGSPAMALPDSVQRLLPRDTSKRAGRSGPTRPLLLVGNRDWIISVDCTADGLALSPSGQRIAATALASAENGTNPLREAVQQLIARRQATVRPGEPPYRPLIRFRVHPEGLRSYYLAYPALDGFGVPMTRENVE